MLMGQLPANGEWDLAGEWPAFCLGGKIPGHAPHDFSEGPQ